MGSQKFGPGSRRRQRAGLIVAAVLAVGAMLLGGGVASAQGAPAGHLATSVHPAIAGDFTAVNADGGVYWRNSPNWSDTDQIPGYGFYNGDQMYLVCYSYGGAVAPYGNTLWYFAYDDSRGDTAGWVNDHFLNTPGTAASPQPQTGHC
jgi:hypothetical protein